MNYFRYNRELFLTIFNEALDFSSKAWYIYFIMSKVTISFERESKFPEWATPEILKAMRKEGRTLQSIADQFGVSAEAVRQRVKKARKE